jgi:hypothetical protein
MVFCKPQYPMFHIKVRKPSGHLVSNVIRPALCDVQYSRFSHLGSTSFMQAPISHIQIELHSYLRYSPYSIRTGYRPSREHGKGREETVPRATPDPRVRPLRLRCSWSCENHRPIPTISVPDGPGRPPKSNRSSPRNEALICKKAVLAGKRWEGPHPPSKAIIEKRCATEGQCLASANPTSRFSE